MFVLLGCWVSGVARLEAGLLPVVVGAHSGAFDLVPKEAPQERLEIKI